MSRTMRAWVGPVGLALWAACLIGPGRAAAATVVVTGTETIDSDDYFGGAANNVVLSGATLQWTTATFNLSEAMTMGTGTINTMNTGVYTPTLSGAFSGSGTLQKTGTGTLTLTGSLSSLTGAVHVNAGTLDVNNAANTTLAGGLYGTGTLLKRGAGMLTLSGDPSGFTGPVNLNAGTLNFNHATATTLAGAITGAGTLRKTGLGRLTLSGNSAAFTGSTQLMVGTLAVNGSLGGNVAVSSGATLQGTGTIGGNVAGAGTVAPGNSIGTLTISGDYTPSAGSVLEIEVNDATSDRLTVTGNADVTNATLRGVALQRITDHREYRFLTATAITGPFDAIDTGVLDFTAELRNGNTQYWILIDRQPYASVATTRRQMEIAVLLDSRFPTATGDLAAVMTELDTLSAAPLRSAYEQIGGQIYGVYPVLTRDNTAYLYGMLADRLRADVTARRTCGKSNRRSCAESCEETCGETCGETCDESCGDPARAWSSSVTGYGRGGTVCFDGQSQGYQFSVGGLVATLQRDLGSDAKGGFFYNYGRSYVNMTGALQNDSEINSHHFGGYLHSQNQGRYLTMAGGFGFDAFDTHRRLHFGTDPGAIDRTAEDGHNGWQSSVYTEMGGLVEGSTFLLQPFVGVHYLYTYQGSVVESGADSLDLTIGGSDLHALRTLLGFRLSAAELSPYLGSPNLGFNAYWTHDMLNRIRGSANAALDGSEFRLRGLNAGRDWFTFGPGLTWDFGPRLRLFADYNVVTNSQAAYHTGQGGIEYSW